MTITQSLLTFLLAAGVLTITPGVDTVMVLRTSTLEGPRHAAFAALGIGLGCLLWGAAVALGLGALLAASELAFTLLKWAGAAYLVWLGVGLIRAPRSSLALPGADGTATARRGGMDWLRKGLFTNLLNPKVGVFYITLLPQFVPGGVPVAGYTFLLAVIHVGLGLLWGLLLIGASVPLSRTLSRPSVIKAMDRMTGFMFIAFGARLALARR
ncbi:LysE family translocator [Melittangium boletus]|uniref:Lysine transporter LysE n=1 Tax=Melittangium boletus DSM 14713 TaxID=1294270 RepID=A0A250IP41_9BACT|nr:LysE family translocator [Melittangium boletus]ATB33515.1 lysine transporter LysE [Melittangium boletus DSM 14713]